MDIGECCDFLLFFICFLSGIGDETVITKNRFGKVYSKCGGIKENNDKATFIVMPLTSAPNGVGVNKIKLGTVNSLPSSLKSNDTYAVYNQVRTVNADRFIALKEGSAVKECQMEKHIFHKLLF